MASLAKGQRAYCNWDEDATTMGVEAARLCLGSRTRASTERLAFCTTTSSFADVSAAITSAIALGLAPELEVLDLGGSHRAGLAGLANAFGSPGRQNLVIASERLRARPASAQEMQYGAGAAAFLVSDKNIAAEFIGYASRSALFIERFRATENNHDYGWEERWVRDEGYLKLGVAVIREALAKAHVKPSQVAKFVFSTVSAGAAAPVARALGIPPEAIADPLFDNCGFTGAAHPLLMLTDALDKAAPGDVLVVASFSEGGEVVILRATERLGEGRPPRSLADTLKAGVVDSSYLRMASSYEEIDPDWGMRAERDTKTALTEQYRSAEQIYGFEAGKCGSCGAVQFPQLAFCVNCAASSKDFRPVPLADEAAKILTYTADSLTYHPSPPLYVGFAQFDNGARVLMEFVDVNPETLAVGMPLTFRFRIKERDKQRGYIRYFWKAAPTA
ncbi:MAG: 3-oxoacyl-[acyl-carrier-protein] synthase III C-terminal domain-containing protein [Rhizomicrobium sp.]